jgi:hypothetical protein
MSGDGEALVRRRGRAEIERWLICTVRVGCGEKILAQSENNGLQRQDS